jgi:CDGSH-type Zn-finger protein
MQFKCNTAINTRKWRLRNRIFIVKRLTTGIWSRVCHRAMLSKNLLNGVQKYLKVVANRHNPFTATSLQHSAANTKTMSRRFTSTVDTHQTGSEVIMNRLGLEQKTIVEQSLPITSYCRCWLSKTFPKCDGSHKQHNLETGDKVGPLVVQIPTPNKPTS